jgi:hypothetical protein
LLPLVIACDTPTGTQATRMGAERVAMMCMGISLRRLSKNAGVLKGFRLRVAELELRRWLDAMVAVAAASKSGRAIGR